MINRKLYTKHRALLQQAIERLDEANEAHDNVKEIELMEEYADIITDLVEMPLINLGFPPKDVKVMDEGMEKTCIAIAEHFLQIHPHGLS